MARANILQKLVWPIAVVLIAGAMGDPNIVEWLIGLALGTVFFIIEFVIGQLPPSQGKA